MKSRLVGLLPTAAVALAEAAWIAVAQAATAGLFRLPPPAIGLWTLAVLVGAGIALGRSAILHARRRPSLVRSAAAIGAGAAALGIVAGTTSPLILDPTAASAGVFVGVAIWQGTRHGDPRQDDVVMADLLRLGLPALVIPWVFGGTLPGPMRDPFIADALPATLLFVAAALSAIGLTRLEALGRESGVDWSSNHGWLALLAAVLLGLAAISLPAAFLLGAPLATLVHAVVAPLGAASDLAAAGFGHLAGLLPSAPPQGSAPGGATPGTGTPPNLPTWASALAVAVVFAGLVGGGIFLARRVRGVPKDGPMPPVVREERRLELSMPQLGLSLRLPRLSLRRRPAVTSIVAAYLDVLAHLEREPNLARSPTESPRAHARRVRPVLGWRMSLLAADYELERYAAADVRPSECRRALRRARLLRRR